MSTLVSHIRQPAMRRTALAAAIAWCAFAPATVSAESILFIGNSFTYGAGASVQSFRSNTVTDLRGTNIGGVPALFKAFTEQVNLHYDVFLETQPGSNLDYHYNNQRALIDQPWDNVVMHGQSNLNFAAPNNPALISQYTGILGSMFQAKNADVDISLTATWSRADLTYPANAPGPWRGAPIEQMGIDVWNGYLVAAGENPTVVSRVNPVGLAWNRAWAAGVADANPYDGITTGQINLWTTDHYHASNYGYYLHALVVFGMETGIDPRRLGGRENAAVELGFTASEAYALQSIAWETISAVPEPGTWALMAFGAAGLAGVVRRRKAAEAKTA
jgi:hypothetical protein